MHRLLIASAFVLSLTGVAVAKQEGFPNPYHVAKHTESGACVIMKQSPNPKFFTSMGTYDSMEAAHKAMGDEGLRVSNGRASVHRERTPLSFSVGQLSSTMAPLSHVKALRRRVVIVARYRRMRGMKEMRHEYGPRHFR